MDNDHLLDGATVQITEVFMPDHQNHTMHHLYDHNHGYEYAIVVSYRSSIRMVMN
jgi:hypothetical protein